MLHHASLLTRRRAMLSLAAMGALATPAFAARDMLHGRVFFRERMALPPRAMVEVRLVDVSRADAPSLTIARTRFAAEGRNPIPFVISYDPARILPGRRYGVQARISDGRRLLFISTQAYPVLTGGPDLPNTRPLEIRVDRTRGAEGPRTPQPATPVGRWLAEDIGGRGVLDRAQSTLEIAADGGVAGSGGCNRFFGQAKFDGVMIAFGQLGSTQMACAPAQMDQERRYFKALESARSWRIDPARRKLHLLSAGGAPVATFAAM